MRRRGVLHAECQKKAWRSHKRWCPQRELLPVARAMELSLLGQCSGSGLATMRRLSECFADSTDTAKERLLSMLGATYLPPVVSLEGGVHVAFYPQLCAGVFCSRAEALRAVVPFCVANASGQEAWPALQAGQFFGRSGSKESPVFLSWAEWALLARALGRHSQLLRDGAVGLMPSDFQVQCRG